ncbi:MAG: hypothetical protein IPK60_22035 [Sandaracinaceae bacterium]|nr:hypothetical protein [Sandaracinaceae bacterium]
MDVFVRDTIAGTTVLVTNPPTGMSSNGHAINRGISGDGRYVAFTAQASNFFPGDTNIHQEAGIARVP